MTSFIWHRNHAFQVWIGPCETRKCCEKFTTSPVVKGIGGLWRMRGERRKYEQGLRLVKEVFLGPMWIYRPKAHGLHAA